MLKNLHCRLYLNFILISRNLLSFYDNKNMGATFRSPCALLHVLYTYVCSKREKQSKTNDDIFISR